MPIRKITLDLAEATLREVDEEAERANMTREQWLGIAVQRALDRQLTVGAMDALLAKVEEKEKRPRRTLKRPAKAQKKKMPRRAAG